MLKKKLLFGLIPVAIVILLILFLLVSRNTKLGPGEPLQAIPVDASVILKINDLEALLKKFHKESRIWDELKITPSYQRLENQLQFLDSILLTIPETRQLLLNAPSYISLHYTGKDKICFFHVYEMPNNLSDRKIHALISRYVVNLGTITERNYDGKKIYDVRFLNENNIRNFSYAVFKGLFLLSFSSLLLEDAIRQMDGDLTVAHEEGFNQAFLTAGKNVDANLFLNFKNLPKSLSVGVTNEYKAEVRSFTTFANWGELDVNILSDVLLLNGFILASDSDYYATSIFQHQNPQKITVDEILPSSVASCLVLSVSDSKQYFSDYYAYLKGLGKYNQYSRSLDVLENTYEIDFMQAFMDVWDNEISMAFDATYSDKKKPVTYLLLKVKSQSQAEERFTGIIRKMSEKESISPQRYTSVYKIDNELSYIIYQLPIRRITGKIFGELFTNIDEHYFTFVDNYLIFSDSRTSLGKLLHNVVLNKTLVTNQAYKDFKTNLAPKSNLYFYANIGKANVVFSNFLSEPVLKVWNENIEAFQKIQVFGFQMYSSNGMLYSNVFLKHFTDFKDQPHTVWESRLDTTIDSKPVFTLNHSTRQNEVVVQDQKNSIYLINQAGRILWKISLDEKINSEIFQIDYYKNGKLQLLFSTPTYIHLIDRNGNYVEKYPVRLRSPATNPLALFDYDRNKNYRIFIAGSDRKVYAYNIDGSLVKGWDFETTESEVWQPVNHFKVGDKDYIVFGDRFKTYILDRRGNTRVNVKAYFPRSVHNNYILDYSGKVSDARVITTDTAGLVHFIYFNGNHTTLNIGLYTGDHFFEYKDMNGDGRKEYIFLDKNKLQVFEENKELLYEHDFNHRIDFSPVYYHFSRNDKKLGIVSREENLIYLINNDGTVYKGFPLRGNSPFTIGYFGKNTSSFNLIVGSNDNFLYNYTVQ
ncbi:MAG: DUF3352 domain-containing protein [Bacteroidales bacterium]|nr:DUF3352 domain-containing protein [Bacteroidales bacterium]